MKKKRLQEVMLRDPIEILTLSRIFCYQVEKSHLCNKYFTVIFSEDYEKVMDRCFS